MADFSEIIQEINTNLPDNNTQSITAAKLRTTLIDLTNAIDSEQDSFETSITESIAGMTSFSTGEDLDETAIDNTNLSDPVSGSLAKANDAMQIKDFVNLDNFTSEVVEYTSTNKKYIDRQTGAITNIDNILSSETEISLGNAKYVQFRGLQMETSAGTGSYGYAFGYYSGTTWVTLESYSYLVSGSTRTTKVYTYRIPEQATHFRCMTAAYGVLTEDNFFCKLFYGDILEKDLWDGVYGYGHFVEAEKEVITSQRIINGQPVAQSNFNIWKTNVENTRYIRFSTYYTVNATTYGYTFWDASDNPIAYSRYLNDSNQSTASTKSIVLEVPSNAKTFGMTISTGASVNWWLEKFETYDESLSDRIDDVDVRITTIENSLDETIYDYETKTITTSDLSGLLRKDNTTTVRCYIDADEADVLISISLNSVVQLTVVENKNGTTTGNNNVVSNVKKTTFNWKRNNDFTNLVLTFTTSDSSEISVAQVISSIVAFNISYKISKKYFAVKANEIEMPITGLTVSDDGTYVIADSIYTPEQYNFGGFRMICPSYMYAVWYRGNNPDNFTDSYGRKSDVINGQVINFLTKYSYNNIFRLRFKLIGNSRQISVSDVRNVINEGKLKIVYTPNDGLLSITQRQSHCDPYVRALEARLVTNFSDTQRKCYGTHDLPMFVHCTDIHNDIVRLSSAMEYARYIQADAMILTGDYCMRGATNGYGYVKEIEEKWNPSGTTATQVIPYLVGTGNHDPWHISLADMRAELIEPFIEKHNYRLDADNLITNTAYYYVDLNIPAPRDGGYEYGSSTYNHTQLVRIIMLDIVDDQGGQISRWGISQAQINWFINTLNSTPDGAAVLVGLHTLPDLAVAPSDKAAEVASGGTRELKYVSDMFTYKGFVSTNDEQLNGSYTFYGLPIVGNVPQTSPIVDIIDAYISRSALSNRSYQYTVGGSYAVPTQAESTTTVTFSCDFTNAQGTFVAYLCGHTHADMITYIANSIHPQLCLCTTCTVCEYGPYSNGRGSSNSDCLRGSSGSTQDGFTVYVLDMVNKRVGLARIGSNMNVNFEPRTACWLSFTDTAVA